MNEKSKNGQEEQLEMARRGDKCKNRRNDKTEQK